MKFETIIKVEYGPIIRIQPLTTKINPSHGIW